MPSFRSTLAAGLLLSTLALSLAAADLPRKASDFTIHQVDGKTLTLSQYRGHPVVLAFILTSCSHCHATVKVLAKLQTEYAPRGLQIVASAIEQDAQSHVNLFVRNFSPGFPVGYNTGAEADILIHPTGKLAMMPLMGFFDKQGVMRSQHEGEEPFFSDLEQNLRKEIDGLFLPKK